MPKISDLDYVSEIDATSYLLGVKGGSTVRFPASVLQGETPIVNTTFIGQWDTPASYADQAGKLAAVNTAEDALEFIDAPTSLPVGGTTGQVLTKQSATDGDADWDDASGGTEIAIGSTAPASPVDGQLWLDESQGVQDQNNFIDVTNFTTDYPLRRGETAVVIYSGATTIPLHIKTVEGVYEIEINGRNVASTNDNDNVFLVNGAALGSSLIKGERFYFGPSSNVATVSPVTKAPLCGGTILKSIIRVCTSTLGKTLWAHSTCIQSGRKYYSFFYDLFWDDTTTVWATLGTISLGFAQSGTVIIRRLY